MKILFVASEVDPFAKTGGLADVAGALPKALSALGHDIRIVMPLYRQVPREKFGLKSSEMRLTVPVGAQTFEGHVWEALLPNSRVVTYFIEQPSLFDREGLYQSQGADHPDNLERFSFFSLAALHMLPRLGWKPDVIHCHDWQTALVCAHLRYGAMAREPFFANVGTVFTIHNLAYQGLFPQARWASTQLPESAFSIQGLEFYGQLNCLKGALTSARMLTTVSQAYAREIQTSEFGCGLEGVLNERRDDLAGIVNGLDLDEWNPQTDPHLAAHYSLKELAGKALCKLSLQQQQRLEEHHGLLIGMVQRLAEQKGIDIFTEALESLMALPIQIVILGTGELVYHQRLEQLAKRFPGRFALNLTFSNALAHQIEAGADAFLMPSRFEPCGLNQMYSMRYGTVPIVRRVGGLADTVTDVDPASMTKKTATGFVFDEYSATALANTVQRAVAGFNDHGLWEQLMIAGMSRDFSWGQSAQAYLRVYDRATSTKPSPLSRVR